MKTGAAVLAAILLQSSSFAASPTESLEPLKTQAREALASEHDFMSRTAANEATPEIDYRFLRLIVSEKEFRAHCVCGEVHALKAKTFVGALALIYLKKKTELGRAQVAYSNAVMGQTANISIGYGFAVSGAARPDLDGEIARTRAAQDKVQAEVAALAAQFKSAGLLQADGTIDVFDGVDYAFSTGGEC